MRFVFIDRIIHYEKQHSLKGIKTLSLAEEYLKDHFPKKPILPGVLMLETLVQAGAWLVRLTHDFNYSLITLASAKAIRYGKFVSPGDTLTAGVEWKRSENNFVELTAKGTVAGDQVVSAKLKLQLTNLADLDPKYEKKDAALREYYRELFSQVNAANNVNAALR